MSSDKRYASLNMYVIFRSKVDSALFCMGKENSRARNALPLVATHGSDRTVHLILFLQVVKRRVLRKRSLFLPVLFILNAMILVASK
jgi:hypothetical protein